MQMILFFAEEVDPSTDQMVGNMPQTFVHASFIGAVIELAEAQKQITFL